MNRALVQTSAVALLTAGLAGCFAPEPIPSGHRGSSRSPSHRPGAGETYVVTRGDTLYSIAFRNQLDFHDLANWNGIGRDYTIYPGQVLRLSPPSRPALPPAVASVPRSSPPPRKPSAPRSRPGHLVSAEGWEWPTPGPLLRAFDADGNKGIDIGGRVGQLVVASQGGKVVYSGSALKGYGELIIIKHDEDFLSAYGYNRRRLVEEGQTVVGGQPIAELGLGPEQRPLLHFEIREHGKPVDPQPLLPAH